MSAKDSSFLAVEFFFGEGAFVAELLELAQLVDYAVLGVGGGVVGGIGAVVAAAVRSGPNQAEDPADKSPAKKEVDREDAAGAGVAAHGSDDGREEIQDKADTSGGEAEDSMKKMKGKE